MEAGPMEVRFVVYGLAIAAGIYVIIRYARQYNDFLYLSWLKDMRVQQRRETHARMLQEKMDQQIKLREKLRMEQIEERLADPPPPESSPAAPMEDEK